MVGVGYRPKFAPAFFSSQRPAVSWIEVITENYFPFEGKPTEAMRALARLRADFPVALHGVGLSLASADPLSEAYLSALERLIEETDPFLVTDHLCWTGVNGDNLFDLFPFPYTKKNLRYLESRVQQVQDRLKRPLALENITYYAQPAGSELSEAEFLSELARRTGCGLLLDLNNVYVNAVNLGMKPLRYLESLDLRAVCEIHLAGFSRAKSGLLIDTHGTAVCEEVWALYEWVHARLGDVPTMIERDENIPQWQEMELELARISEIRSRRKEARLGSIQVAGTLSL